jgi:hypothetical protein
MYYLMTKTEIAQKKSVSQYIEPIILSQCNKTIITLAAMRLQTAETNSSFDVGVRQYTLEATPTVKRRTSQIA